MATTNFTLPDTSFPHLQRFAAFLLAHYVEEAANATISLARQVNLPLLELFANMPEDQFIALVQDSLKTFFQQLVEQQALEDAKDTLRQWRKDTLPHIPRSGVATADLVLVYHVRRQMMLSFVDRYTTEIREALAIAKELDLLYAEVERFAFSQYVDLKEDEHGVIQLELQEKNQELATALEELKAAEEQLLEANSELEARVEERTRALRTSEQQLRIITDALPGLITYVDADERYRFLNKTYEEWFDLSRSEVVGKKMVEVYGLRLGKMMGPAAYDQVKVNIQRALKGERLQYETILTTKHQGQKHVLVNYVPHVVEGQVLGYFALATDITERKLAEQALQESRDLFHSFADHIQNLAWMTDPAGNVLWYNQRWYDYTGTSFDDMQDMGWLRVHHPDHTKRVLDHVQKAGERGRNWELTFPIRRADGEWGWFLSRAYAVKDTAGNIIRWIGTSTEITGQVKAREQLQKANEEIVDLLQRETDALEEALQQRKRLYNLFMQAPSLLCINRGRDFVYELANPSYLEALMVDNSIIGKTVKEAFPDADPAIMQIYSNVFEKGERFVGSELPITGDWKRNKQPYTRYFNLIYEPIRELDGATDGIITFGYEVTEQVSARQKLEQNAILMQELNQELTKKNEELGKINNDLDSFIYTASHDLRSPLLNLEGLLLALNKRLTASITPEAANLLTLAGTSIEKLKETIKDLTEITKAQKGLDETEDEAVDVKETVEDIKTDLPENFNSLAPFIKMDFGVTTIRYSKAGLRSILYNLLSNAIKYRSDVRPLEIGISTSLEDGYVVLRVEDNGLGIPEQQLPKLFTMFRRLHTHVEGTGIGLYIIKRIIENNGGRIEVSSQLDKGSIFTVYLANRIS
jgi:PAS domain S-box-containing protein